MVHFMAPPLLMLINMLSAFRAVFLTCTIFTCVQSFASDAHLVTDLELSVRATNVLRNAGFETVHSLTETTRAEVAQLPNSGRKVADEVAEALYRSGNRFKGEPNAEIVSLELSVRSWNVLRNSGIQNLDQLTGMTRAQVAQLPNAGRKVANEIADTLALRGLHFRDDPLNSCISNLRSTPKSSDEQ